jgi:hypothetical protein
VQVYNSQDGKWHSECIAKCKKLSNEQLLFIQKDCREAIQANPEGSKVGQYLDESHYCSMELVRRRAGK